MDLLLVGIRHHIAAKEAEYEFLAMFGAWAYLIAVAPIVISLFVLAYQHSGKEPK